MTEPDLQAVLREQFGHDVFRPGQEHVVRTLLAGRDALAILPTGGGKSLVYQLAAQLLPGLTLVVSPLLALMKDQVASLDARGVHVAVINSAQSLGESQQALADARQGHSKLLYVTPERFDDPEFMAEMRALSISLFVVDEAHSISDWGHSFRPAYLALPAAITQLKRPTILALTATATPWVRREIVSRLGMRDPRIVVHGTDRPNLFFDVVRVEEETQDRRVLQRLLTQAGNGGYPDEVGSRLDDLMAGSGIIYTATTRAAEETAAWLTEWGISADYYHGQRRKSDRARVQDAFMAGDVRVIVATNAFGMGVDKPDVRFVIHRDIPASLEGYYQEAGRAGRDGNAARCTLIYRPGDLGRAAFLAGGGELTREEVVRAREGLVSLDGAGATIAGLQAASGLGRADLVRLVDILVDQKLAERRRGRIRLRVPDFDPEAIPLEREAHRRLYERSRLDMMRGYAELRDCRRRYVLNYFGEEPEWRRCDSCDVDVLRTAGPEDEWSPATEPGAFAIDDRVEHPSLGQGVVQRVTPETLTVLFEKAGYKILDTAIIEEQDLLKKTG